MTLQSATFCWMQARPRNCGPLNPIVYLGDIRPGCLSRRQGQLFLPSRWLLSSKPCCNKPRKKHLPRTTGGSRLFAPRLLDSTARSHRPHAVRDNATLRTNKFLLLFYCPRPKMLCPACGQRRGLVRNACVIESLGAQDCSGRILLSQSQAPSPTQAALPRRILVGSLLSDQVNRRTRTCSGRQLSLR